MLTINGLVTKMIATGVIRRKNRDIVFTVKFGAYLYGYASTSPLKIGNLSGWRDLLAGYNPSFRDLSNDEAAAIAVLIDYHASKTQDADANSVRYK